MGSLHQNPLVWSSCLNDELTILQKVTLEVREESNESNGKDDNNDLNDNDDLELENESVIGKSNSTYSNSKEKLSKDLGYIHYYRAEDRLSEDLDDYDISSFGSKEATSKTTVT